MITCTYVKQVYCSTLGFSSSYPSGQPVQGTLAVSLTLAPAMDTSTSALVLTQTKKVRFYRHCSRLCDFCQYLDVSAFLIELAVF